MIYEPRDFEHLLGIEGFSLPLIKNHLSLYRGYVEAANRVEERLRMLVTEGQQGSPEYAELKRRFAWEYNGMRLHEFYFGNMIKGGTELDPDSLFARKVIEDYGTYENWQKDFGAVAQMRGIGWTILSYDPPGERLINGWINEHDTGHLAGTIPLLVLDVFEHAFMTDYGLKRVEYLEAFFRVLNWQVVIDRLDVLNGSSSKSRLESAYEIETRH